MNKLNQIINKLYEQKDLTVEESSFIFNEIKDGKVNEITGKYGFGQADRPAPGDPSIQDICAG